MRDVIIILVSLSICIFSCNKESENIPDDIMHYELNPQLELTSVDSLINHPSGCGNIPIPSDSSASLSLDINNDGTNDFSISCLSWYEFVSASGPCANYNTSITIHGTTEKNKISIQENYNTIKTLNFNDIIDNSYNWHENATLMISSAQAPFSTNFNGSVYLGLKLKQDEEEYFGWLYINKSDYLITIMSYAINQTAHNCIHAGQTE